MIQYYTAIGRYELSTNEHGEKHPILISNRREYAPGLCEMLLWSSLLWHIRDQEELAQDFARRKAELHICDEYSLHYYCVRLERLGFLRRGSGYTAADALFDLLAPLYPVPADAGLLARGGSFFHLVFRRGVALRVAWRVFHRDKLAKEEQCVMGLLAQNSLSTAELIACVDQGLQNVQSEALLLDRLYSEPQLTCDVLPAYVRASGQLIPVLQAVTNLYLRRLLVLEQY